MTENTPPCAMTREDFITAFGDIFEHSPWVAEAAYDNGLGAECNTAAGLCDAMVAAFRAGDEAQRFATLKAHPDLAGKLAAAGRLTADSTAEQQSAGLDMLTDSERAEFTRLNTAYTEKFGFPFIIAVRNHDKAGIMAAFKLRLTHDRDTELAEAYRQIERIAGFRIAARLG